MPFHPVTAALMYRGIYTIPNILAEQHPVDIPEDELEGKRDFLQSVEQVVVRDCSRQPWMVLGSPMRLCVRKTPTAGADLEL
uniref:Uncharacterized protein n=1 Tax=Sphaerodactylus townsendi TaxID=933632 RepID=A0ACB8FY29_9SAUR